MSEGFFAELSADLLHHGHSVRFRAKGESMHPTIREGEAITVEPVKPSDVRFADIILYRAEKAVIAHRVVGRRNINGTVRTFLVRGDAVKDHDKPVADDQVLGKVVSVERGGRTIVMDRRTAKIWHLGRLFVYRIKRQINPFGL